jgi:crossover junction endodeoxyribonuclease RuvC
VGRGRPAIEPVNPTAKRVLGIDTSLRCTGVGVVEASGGRLAAVEFGTLRTRRTATLSDCLRGLMEGIEATIERTRPGAAAIEGAFFCRNANTAMILGQARGVAIAACARRGLPVYEYAPRRVKQAVVGFGGAAKEQVQKMVLARLGLRGPVQEDAGDALAIAVCHLQCHGGHRALQPQPI